jgi:hypothetical protein
MIAALVASASTDPGPPHEFILLPVRGTAGFPGR